MQRILQRLVGHQIRHKRAAPIQIVQLRVVELWAYKAQGRVGDPHMVNIHTCSEFTRNYPHHALVSERPIEQSLQSTYLSRSERRADKLWHAALVLGSEVQRSAVRVQLFKGTFVALRDLIG